MDDMTYAEKQAILVQFRRGVLAAMETGQHDKARTAIRELEEFDINEARRMRADITASYGIAF